METSSCFRIKHEFYLNEILQTSPLKWVFRQIYLLCESKNQNRQQWSLKAFQDILLKGNGDVSTEYMQLQTTLFSPRIKMCKILLWMIFTEFLGKFLRIPYNAVNNFSFWVKALDLGQKFLIKNMVCHILQFWSRVHT